MTSDAGRAGDTGGAAAGTERARAMLARDAASAALGIELLEAGPGLARVRMALRPDMLQGHGTGHGGIVFALADTAFAVACNSTSAGPAVAASAEITFVRPVAAGEVLVAEAVETVRYGRAGVTDVTVRRQGDGEVVALFRGRSLELTRAPGPQATTTRGA